MVEIGNVFVTGLGPISSIGMGRTEFWSAILRGQSGISRIERFDTENFDSHVGGEIKNFDVKKYFSSAERNRYGRAAQYAILATQLAIEDAGFGPEELRSKNVAVCLGTTMADAPSIEAFDDDIATLGSCRGPTLRRRARQYASCMIALQVAARFGIQGRVFMIPTACAAGNYAISYATDLILAGKCDIAVAGGVDPLSRIAFSGFNRILAVAPEKCQPFDRNRRGMLIGEGAGILILESERSVVMRGARPFARIAGRGASCDAQHMTIPSVEGIASVMRKCLSNARRDPGEVDYVSAHGTGTQANDRAESAGILAVFGERGRQIPVSSIKSMLGHTMGAASALEAIACALAVHTDAVPPTINYETPDPECPIDCVPNRARKTKVKLALNNSFAFGGNNASVLFEKIQ